MSSVSYAMLSKRDSNASMVVLFILLLGKLHLWNALPNGHHAYFFDVNSGKTRHPQEFHQKLPTALTQVFDLLAQGRIQAQVAQRVPLEQAAEGMRLAESGKMVGKVVLVCTPSKLTTRNERLTVVQGDVANLADEGCSRL